MFEGGFYSTSTLYLLRCSPSRHLWHVPSAAGVSSNATKYPRRSFQYQQYDRKWKNFTNRNCRIFFLGGFPNDFQEKDADVPMISSPEAVVMSWWNDSRWDCADSGCETNFSTEHCTSLGNRLRIAQKRRPSQSKGNNFRFATWLRVTYKWDILTCLAIWYMYVRFNHDLYSVLHKYAYPNRMSAVLHPRSSSFLLFWQRFSC